ncbi:MAG: hypothetical protein ACPGQS_00510 [Bradymonadia bacterium]
MRAYRLIVFSMFFLPGCLLFLDEPAPFPDPPADATCIHDTAVEEDWGLKEGMRDVDLD